MKIKLRLPFFCVALLSIGMMPVTAAMPESVSDSADLDPSETAAAIAQQTPSELPISGDLNITTDAIANYPGNQNQEPHSWQRQEESASPVLAEDKLRESAESQSPTWYQLTALSQESDRETPIPNSPLAAANPSLSQASDRQTPTPNSPLAAANPSLPTTEIPRLNEIERPKTRVDDLFQQPAPTFRDNFDAAQISQSVVQVTGVRLNPTASGLEIILETKEGQQLQGTTRTQGKTAIVEIPNAQLVLPDGQEFSANNPDEGISLITVNQLENNRIQVTVTGEKVAPSGQVVKSDSGLVFSLTAGEGIEITVTGQQESPYRVPNATSATRTNTPIRDIPQSIQVIPQQVIEDQQITRLDDAVRNVSGVTLGGTLTGRGSTFGLRGFGNAPVLRDGFRRFGFAPSFPEVANLDRVEVLKGPASILYGEIQPGGLINLVSKQPLEEPFYEAELQLGNLSLVRPRIDFSCPLTSDRSLLYRLNALYLTNESFRGYEQDDQRFFIAPTLTWRISDRADLTVSLEYTDEKHGADNGLPAIGNRVVDVPRDRIGSEPDDKVGTEYLNVGYNFEYRFSNNWRLRNAFRYSSYDYDFNVIALQLGFDDETADVTRFWASQEAEDKNYTLQTNVVGEFATGSVKHTLLFGADISYNDERTTTVADFETPLSLNIFHPVYGQVPKPDEDTLATFSDNETETSRYGFYVQDQISIFDNLKLLAGIRYDTAEQKNRVNPTSSNQDSSETTKNYDAFTPRVGIVYQPIPELSLYASYSRSFNPGSATTSSGSLIEPETGEGYEVGVKAELLDRRLFATLAYFDITKQNVAVTDPNNSLFSIASGEQRSRGVEFDVSGEILPGWNIIAAYAYTDAEVTEDTNRDLVGNRLFNVPKHSASLWTTYQIQSGELRGLGLGVGFNYVGERKGDLDNSFEADSYFLTNAAIFYERDNLRFAINIKNLFNINYIEGVRNSRAFGNQPGEPLTVIGSFTIKF